jgi:hypothetical protein
MNGDLLQMQLTIKLVVIVRLAGRRRQGARFHPVCPRFTRWPAGPGKRERKTQKESIGHNET